MEWTEFTGRPTWYVGHSYKMDWHFQSAFGIKGVQTRLQTG